jgi:ATP-dependent helicase IRC3
MKITQTSPVRIELEGFDWKSLEKQLTYIDKSVDFELSKLKKNRWLLNKIGEEAWREQINDLKAKRTQCLLMGGQEEGYWTYSGLGWWLADKYGIEVENLVAYPEAKNVPWAKIPEKKARPYQEEMKTLLEAARHAGVEVGTGLGKSFVIMLLAKAHGLKTVVMTPSVNIAEQIHGEFLKHFGKKYVGQFFDGKKESNKLFVVAVDDSLSLVDKDSEHWRNLSKAQVFIADESHLCPAKSLARVCLGLLSQAPYRYFFSGTQMRNDGLDLLLGGITGKIVFTMTVQEGVEQGWLAKPMFRVIKTSSSDSYYHSDANMMTRAHLYYNDEVNAKAAEIANLMVEEMNRPVVILIKELEQFSKLVPYLRHEVKFAHGGVTKTTYKDDGETVKKAGNDRHVPKEFWDSDPTDLVEAFNRGEFPILIGTSCITTGTDIQNVGAIVYCQGGKSEIQVKQCVGRGTRKPEGKEDCYFIDFDVENVEVLHRHAEARKDIYANIYPDFEELSL